MYPVDIWFSCSKEVIRDQTLPIFLHLCLSMSLSSCSPAHGHKKAVMTPVITSAFKARRRGKEMVPIAVIIVVLLLI